MVFEDFASAHGTILGLAFLIAMIMGAVVNKTNFCTMGAVSDWVNMNDTGRLRAWLFAIGVALLGVILLEALGGASMDITRPPYRGTSFAWLEYVIGGVMFGVGMTLGSGCGNKTLIRIGGGNLKSIVVLAVISVCAYYMVNPFPGTDATLYSTLFYPWTNPASVSLPARQDLGALLGSFAEGSNPVTIRLWIGLAVVAALTWFVFRSTDFRGRFDNILGGLVVGLAVVGAWYISGNWATISMEGETFNWTQYASDENWSMVEEAPRPRGIAVQSYTFINPMGETLGYIASGFDSTNRTFGVMALLGVIAGSLLWALISRGFRIEWFVSFKDFLTHVIGAVLMGVGGILALGCTIGQAVTGVSTMALGSVLAFASIVFGSALTMKIQYYKLVYEDEATFTKALITALVDMKMLPGGMRKLEAV
ncbi:MAG: YeeE/YedE family protein [Pseudomonadota bacterium]|nr:MAG: YeeE/YedE family protein [Pseudomonadota bacterium]